jgi:Fur family peroxide stress response transcriptional regulator
MMQQTKIEYLLGQLEAAGKRSTPQRVAVCRALIEHGGHPTVAEVFELVRAAFPMMSQATVYNTIDTLEDLGLVHRLEIANSEHTHYDLDQNPHINIVCTGCGSIVDLHIDDLDAFLARVSSASSYAINTQTAMVLYGCCPQCRHRSAAGQQHAVQTR